MTRTNLRCREIADADLTNVIDLLTVGFSDQRNRAYWEHAIDRLTRHDTPPGFPRFGYLLEHAGAVVGVILQIFSQAGPGAPVRCNMSSWWMKPEFRMYGSLLVSRALRHNATYINITPAPHTWPILEAQGYAPYCNGRMVALPWLCRSPESARIQRFEDGMVPDDHLTARDLAVLRDHAAYGCISLVCEAGGRRYPFVFAPRQRLGILRLALLTYCRMDADILRFAGALGRYLALRGYPLVVLDTNGPLPGVPGWYSGSRPKYFRGPDRPRIGDFTYSERAMFGS